MNLSIIVSYIYWTLFGLSIIFFLFYLFPKFKREFYSKTDISKNRLEYFLDYLGFISNFFISLGIFGTFLGITFGLMGLKFNNVENLKSNISKLLNSMNLAFISSLFGIFFSIFCRFVFDKFTKDIDERINQIEKADKDDLLFALNSIRLEISNLGQSSFSEIAKTLNGEVKNYVNCLQENTAPIIDNFISKFDRINNILEDSIKAIQDSLDFIRQYKEAIEESQFKLKNQFEEISNISEKIKEITFKLNDSVNKIINISDREKDIIDEFYNKIDYTNKLFEKFTELADKSISLLNESSQSLAEIPDSIDDFLTKSTYTINEYPNLLKKGLSNSFIELDEYIANIINSFKNITNLIDNSISNFQNSLENFNKIQKNFLIQNNIQPETEEDDY